MIPQQPEQKLPVEISVIITERDNKPCVELRRKDTNIEVIKTVVSCAFHQRPIILLPVFRNKIQSLNSLLEKGIIYLNPDDKKYYFTV